MQCPKCGYEPTLSEVQRSPSDCVKCGVNYEGYARSVEAQRQAREAEQAQAVANFVAPHVRKMAADNRGAQPVVIVDAQMSFNSMVWFMVKWSIAAIPALMILITIGFLSVLLLGGLAGISK
ncbi:hypothetical protein [Stutzerimonas nitrititolerans]|uniref:hypothetical protein n=1 Tax=Stutzerimonas nitrititolerans TaxID=2482751 RepID=UPI0028B1064A|nr:hypothetical protein [Stutzerimonas nitrititolerans]